MWKQVRHFVLYILLYSGWPTFVSSQEVEEARACLGDTEFIIVNQFVNFDTARDECALRGGFLGGVINEQQHLHVIELARAFANRDVWIGTLSYGNPHIDKQSVLVGLIASRGGNDPLRFDFEDPALFDKSFFDENGQRPWGNGQPDDNDEEEDCVE